MWNPGYISEKWKCFGSTLLKQDQNHLKLENQYRTSQHSCDEWRLHPSKKNVWDNSKGGTLSPHVDFSGCIKIQIILVTTTTKTCLLSVHLRRCRCPTLQWKIFLLHRREQKLCRGVPVSAFLLTVVNSHC